MDLYSDILPPVLSWFANGLAVLFLAGVIRTTDWRRVASLERLNAWLLTVGFVCVFWAIRAEVSSGLNLHIGGAVLFTLLHGWRFAIVGLALVSVSMTLAGRILPVNLGFQFFLSGVLPVSFAYVLFLMSEARLPRNFFVYIFGPAFLGAWLTTALLAIVTSLLLVVFAEFSWSELQDAFLPFFLILGFSEGFITGFVLTLLVVYKPKWVYTFRDERYFKGK